MTAKELAEELLKHPDFKVKGLFVDWYSDGPHYPKYCDFHINGIADIGYSDKVIVLDLV